MTGLELLHRYHDRLSEAARLLTAPEFIQRNIRSIDQLVNLARQFHGCRVPQTANEVKLAAIAADLIEAQRALPIALDPVEPAYSLEVLLYQLRRRPMFTGVRNSL